MFWPTENSMGCISACRGFTYFAKATIFPFKCLTAHLPMYVFLLSCQSQQYTLMEIKIVNKLQR